MQVLMIVWTIVTATAGHRPASISQTATLVSAATCAKAEEMLDGRSLDGNQQSDVRTRIFVSCIPTTR